MQTDITPSHSSRRENNSRIIWLAVLQGFSMLLVVLGHVCLTGVFRDPQHPFIAHMERIIYTFHMPLFMFVSGWLFFLTCMAKGKSYRGVMLGKLRRLGIPLLVFSAVAAAFKLAFPAFSARSFGISDFVDTFILFRSNPLGEMWFLISLLVIMSAYPVFRWLNRIRMLPLALLVSVALASALDKDIPYYQISKVVQMLPYFISGIICCRYRLIERFFSSPYTLIVTGGLFLVWNVFELPYPYIHWRPALVIAGFVGIAFSIALCVSLSRKVPRLFSSFRDYTFQIFLLGIFFQLAVRRAYEHFPGSSFLYAILFAVSVGVGLYLPVIIAKFVKRYIPFLKSSFGM